MVCNCFSFFQCLEILAATLPWFPPFRPNSYSQASPHCLNIPNFSSRPPSLPPNLSISSCLSIVLLPSTFTINNVLAFFLLDNNCECNKDLLKKRKNVLLKYIDSSKDLELQSLFALQKLVHELKQPRGK